MVILALLCVRGQQCADTLARKIRQVQEKSVLMLTSAAATQSGWQAHTHELAFASHGNAPFALIAVDCRVWAVAPSPVSSQNLPRSSGCCAGCCFLFRPYAVSVSTLCYSVASPAFIRRRLYEAVHVHNFGLRMLAPFGHSFLLCRRIC